jgi:translocation and assembly module TamB
LLVRELAFGSPEGKLTVSGPIEFGDGIDARLALRADRFAVLNRPDRRLVLSGASSIGWRENRAEVQGNFTVDSGLFDIGSANRPQLSDDVVIVGRDEATEARKATAMLDLTIALGNGVALNGRGLDAVLGGKLRLTAKPGEAPQANGTLQIVKGSYSAYGRELNIEQGLLRFTGPLDNPALDMLAMRRKQEVAAGVSVRGTVLAPRVTLVSDPVVPDAEKLSWLVLGRSLDTAGESDVVSLQSAASALLSKGAISGVQSRLASAFGLDTLSVGDRNDSLQERVVTLGKQVSSRLYLGYQRGLESAGNVVQLRYQLSPKLSVEAETGARSALSLFYNIAFD